MGWLIVLWLGGTERIHDELPRLPESRIPLTHQTKNQRQTQHAFTTADTNLLWQGMDTAKPTPIQQAEEKEPPTPVVKINVTLNGVIRRKSGKAIAFLRLNETTHRTYALEDDVGGYRLSMIEPTVITLSKGTEMVEIPLKESKRLPLNLVLDQPKNTGHPQRPRLARRSTRRSPRTRIQ
jgi:hypothetical protein